MGEFNAEERSILSENISKIVIFLNGELETDLIAELQEWLKGQGRDCRTDCTVQYTTDHVEIIS